MNKRKKITYSGKTLQELREEYIRRGIDGAGQVYVNSHGWKVDRTKDIHNHHYDFDGNAFIIRNCPENWGIFDENKKPALGMARVDELNYLKYRLIKDDDEKSKLWKQVDKERVRVCK